MCKAVPPGLRKERRVGTRGWCTSQAKGCQDWLPGYFVTFLFLLCSYPTWRRFPPPHQLNPPTHPPSWATGQQTAADRSAPRSLFTFRPGKEKSCFQPFLSKKCSSPSPAPRQGLKGGLGGPCWPHRPSSSARACVKPNAVAKISALSTDTAR